MTYFYLCVLISVLLVCGKSIKEILSFRRIQKQKEYDELRKQQEQFRVDWAVRMEEAEKRKREPNRVRRQLAADLLFPGMYTEETERGDMVKEWIWTGSYNLDNQRHRILIEKSKQLEIMHRTHEIPW